MLNLNRIITTTALAVCLASPAVSAARPADPHRAAVSSAAKPSATRPPVDLRSPDARDASRTIVSSPQPVEIVERRIGNGFQWGDAGIGAAGTLAIVVLVACLGMLVGQRRRVDRATAASR